MTIPTSGRRWSGGRTRLGRSAARQYLDLRARQSERTGRVHPQRALRGARCPRMHLQRDVGADQHAVPVAGRSAAGAGGRGRSARLLQARARRRAGDAGTRRQHAGAWRGLALLQPGHVPGASRQRRAGPDTPEPAAAWAVRGRHRATRPCAGWRCCAPAARPRRTRATTACASSPRGSSSSCC